MTTLPHPDGSKHVVDPLAASPAPVVPSIAGAGAAETAGAAAPGAAPPGGAAAPAGPAYSPGLEGVIAGESAICNVDKDAGLLYRGYDIEELARVASFEEVAYLLLHGELPGEAQRSEMRAQLAVEGWLPHPVAEMLALLPRGTAPVDALRTGMSMLAGFDEELNDPSHEANLRKSVRIIARVSPLITAYWDRATGREPLYDPPAGSSHAERFLGRLYGRWPEAWEVRALDVILALYAEHEFNASTFAARVTASTMADIYAAVTSALGTLKGPLHGGANEEATKMLREIGTPDDAEKWLMARLAAKQKVMGFGHRVYRKGDSRVPIAREVARDLARRKGQEAWVDICVRLEEVMAREKNLYANLDLYAAPALYLLGVPPELNVPVFALSRVSGWCAHVVEQHDRNRLIRPRCLYTGPARRPLGAEFKGRAAPAAEGGAARGAVDPAEPARGRPGEDRDWDSEPVVEGEDVIRPFPAEFR